jgi:hypothetical protein
MLNKKKKIIVFGLFTVTMVRHEEQRNRVGVLQIIVAHSSTFDHIGYVDSEGRRHFCCTQNLLDLGIAGCSPLQLGHAVISPNSQPPINVYDVEWTLNSVEAKVQNRFDIKKSGRYYLLFSSCLNSTGDVEMTGKMIWMNPYGYLPGELYHFIPVSQVLFFFFSFIIYLFFLFLGLLRMTKKKFQFGN